MSRNVLFSNFCLRDALLVDAHGSNDAQRPRINLSPPITHNTHNHFLPPILAPSFAPLPLTQMGNILDNAMHSTTEKLLVFVVHGHDDEELGAAWGVVHDLTEGEPGILEVVGVASGGGVAHVGEFALGAVWTHGQELFRDGIVENKVAMEEPAGVYQLQNPREKTRRTRLS
jgi:hypothetical protein